MQFLQGLAPVSASSGAQNGAVIDTTDYEGVVFILEVGVMTATGTLDMKIQRSAALAFGSPTDITGAALTQLLAASGGSKCYAIAVPTPSQQYVRCVVTPATAASVFGVTAIPYGKRGTRPPSTGLTQNVIATGV
jgi:hypothetical protein